MAKIFWHNLEIKEIVKLLGSDLQKGLSQKEVDDIQMKIGKNEFPEEKPLSRWKILISQFQSPLIYILVIAGIATLALREFTDSIVIFGAVILNTIVGYLQEGKASKALRELKKVVRHEATVLRDGETKSLNYQELVPGDILFLAPGSKVPADARIIESHNLKINEMALTGEWLPAKKKSESIQKDTSLADRDNMVYMGTVVEDGRGKAVVTETGFLTEIGRVAEMVRESKEEKTPLQKKLAHFSRFVGVVVGLISFFIFIEGIITGNSFTEMFTTAVAVAVSAIPEGLPVALTVILALGMQRILKRKGLVRKLLAAETLGGTSVIASDKTCTLTEGKMKVAEVFALDNKKSTKMEVLKVGAICNEAFIENPKDPQKNWVLIGRPTDKALLSEAGAWGIDRDLIEKKEEKLNEITFDSARKYAASLHKISKDKFVIYALGAPEKILEFSKIDPEKKKQATEQLARLTGKGFRVVASAKKNLKKYDPQKKLESEIKDLKFLGLIALRDPLRMDAKESIKQVQKAGIRTIIVTGDHKLTAKNVAEELGFKMQKDSLLEGKDLDMLSDKELDNILPKVKVYARVEPKHKIRIVEAWQKRGEVVAMTGDGINDAPALKRADIGVALGSGTEVAKETSDLILLSDSFSIIVSAIEEGRAILDNIRKVITYLLTSSFSEVILIAGALLAGFPLPILPAQILWINLVEDGLPDISLAFETKEDDLMDRKPQSQKTPLLTKEMKVIIFVIGITNDFIILGLFFWLMNKGYDIAYVRTIIFVALAINSLLYVFSLKSLRRNLWHINIFSNKFLLAAVSVGFFLLFTAVYFPPFQTLLKTVPLSLTAWMVIIFLGILEVILIEVVKWYFIVKKKV